MTETGNPPPLPDPDEERILVYLPLAELGRYTANDLPKGGVQPIEPGGKMPTLLSEGALVRGRDDFCALAVEYLWWRKF